MTAMAAPALRIHLGADVDADLTRISETVEQALT